eukprot:CAMPEP_0113292910 /NCGR_PEP_ID=MMETSP0008_2-20120614/34977_1 /TAXON_ID=97485 /ORGANISM="Prymnesium parvum" /LENGTH=50 /DNA_ID=CAMNT_0000145207 /DNA_START=23 /DNA_END=171 /DNA_ORIENTATION=+ /assembly_acc=CAM_ASM_000153
MKRTSRTGAGKIAKIAGLMIRTSSTDEFSDGVGSPMNAHRVKSLNEDYET